MILKNQGKELKVIIIIVGELKMKDLGSKQKIGQLNNHHLIKLNKN